MRLLLLGIWCFGLQTLTLAQAQLLQSGPMVGYSDYREVLIWVQTTTPAEVKIGYFAQGENERFTAPVQTTTAGDHIAKVFPHEVDYGKTYTYKLYINGTHIPRTYPLKFQTQALWQYRTDPPAFSFAIGSCTYINETRDDRPNKPYGGGYEIFNNILQKDPDFMLWLGDNTYLREPDFLTERGIRHRYRHTRATPELQALLGSVHHYAVWDDHDYGPNNSDISYVNKDLTETTFNDYWGNLNTDATRAGGIASHFLWNDVEFFMMDNRYHRDPNDKRTPGKQLLGKDQMQWLIQALQSSRAAFKIVCVGGQTITDAAVFENYATYPEERQYLLDQLHKERINGVLFLSGDRHHTEVSRMERPDAYPLIDITCSPLTAGTHRARDEGNSHQVPGSLYHARNFGMINISGPRTDRTLALTIYNTQGEKVWDYKVTARELRYPRR